MKKRDSTELVGNLLEMDPQKAGALGFMARPLVQVTLPHRDQGSAPVFSRNAGSLRLIIQPLMDVKDGKVINYGIPYGTIPRLVLAWLSTEVVKTKNKQIPLGDSLSAFMRELDMVPTGGRWGSITRLREQIKRLFSSTFTVLYEDSTSFHTKGFKIAQEAALFWDPLHPEQATLFGSTITLSDEFYREILAHPVPLDTRILRALKKSPLAIDLYTWLTYRVSYLQGETTIPWEKLEEQFGGGYAQTRDFKRHLVKTMEKVLALYPAKVKVEDRGLVLMRSLPSVPKK